MAESWAFPGGANDAAPMMMPPMTMQKYGNGSLFICDSPGFPGDFCDLPYVFFEVVDALIVASFDFGNGFFDGVFCCLGDFPSPFKSLRF